MIDALGAPQSLLVLGGSSQIGTAIARRYARDRALTVTLAARPGARLDAAADELASSGCVVATVAFDALDTGSHRDLVERVSPDEDIDVAVVAFGLLGDTERAWHDVDRAVELARVNYVGAVSVGVALAARMRRQGHGAIVALSSVAGERVRRSNFVYGSTKAGMDAFYLGLGEALRPEGVRVLVVRPGFVRTRMTEGLDPAPLSVSAEQVADAVVQGVFSHAAVVWVPRPLRPVMSVLRHLPRPVFRRLPM